MRSAKIAPPLHPAAVSHGTRSFAFIDNPAGGPPSGAKADDSNVLGQGSMFYINSLPANPT
jgi:hypothetical protein